MRHFYLLFVAVFVIHLSLNASLPEDQRNNVHREQIKKLHYYLNSKAWQPVDSVTYVMMVELLKQVEGIPLDQVITLLQTELEANNPLFKRVNSHDSDLEKVKGYISDNEIDRYLEDIAKRVADEYPYESIFVPDSKFVNMNAKLPLISYSNIEKLIQDSLIACPDSIKALIDRNQESLMADEIAMNKKKIDEFLSVERIKYNNALIDRYRDSVITEYRNQFINEKVEALKKPYLDSVSRINSVIMRNHNDSLFIVVNEEIRGILSGLLTYANSKPNTINILDRNNVATSLPLQNDTLWYKWVWLKNTLNDSLGIRIENIGRNALRIYIDETVDLSRLSERQSVGIEKIVPSGSTEQKLLKVEAPKIKVSPWKLSGRAYSGLTQTYINQYWSKARGGKSSASTLSTFNYSANLMLPKMKWENWVDAKLGLIYYMPEEGSTVLRNWHKNTDNLEINSRMGISAFKKWYYSADANFKTQFFIGYSNNNAETPSSSFLSPAYLTFSVGLDYKPNDKFSAFLSPISLKNTYVTNPKVDEKNFGLAEGETRKSRIGTSGKVEFTQKLVENVSLRSKSNVFINLGRNKEGKRQWSKIPDFDTENTIDFKVNQFITTQINFQLVYDKDVALVNKNGDANQTPIPRLLVKEFLTLGISYKFQ